jgi:hypothetical protein
MSPLSTTSRFSHPVYVQPAPRHALETCMVPCRPRRPRVEQRFRARDTCGLEACRTAGGGWRRRVSIIVSLLPCPDAGLILSPSLMQNITRGHLRVLTYSHIYNFPALSASAEDNEDNECPGLAAELRVANDVFWIRLFMMSDLGFAEAYMYGDVECDDLVAVFEVRVEFLCLVLRANYFETGFSIYYHRCSCTTERTSPVSRPACPGCSRSRRPSRAPAS